MIKLIDSFYIALFSDLHKLTAFYNILDIFNFKWKK